LKRNRKRRPQKVNSGFSKKTLLRKRI